MAEIIRNRTIRPSTRKDSSVNYRVHIKGLAQGDTLAVNINHESRSFAKTYRFKASDVLQKKSLCFKVEDTPKGITIHWISTQPVNE